MSFLGLKMKRLELLNTLMSSTVEKMKINEK